MLVVHAAISLTTESIEGLMSLLSPSPLFPAAFDILLRLPGTKFTPAQPPTPAMGQFFRRSTANQASVNVPHTINMVFMWQSCTIPGPHSFHRGEGRAVLLIHTFIGGNKERFPVNFLLLPLLSLSISMTYRCCCS